MCNSIIVELNWTELWMRLSVFVYLFWQTDSEGDKKAQKILNELENIDDECEEKSIDFVKTSDDGIQKEYDLPELPALAFYRNKFRTIYKGDLMKEDEILDWVLDLYGSSPDVIETVDRKTLQVLINDVEHLAVFFCECVLLSLFDVRLDSIKASEYWNNQLIYYCDTQMMINASHVLKFWKSSKP